METFLNKIPVIMMFDDNYAIPAGPAILSMLKNSSNKYKYELYVLHNNIRKDYQEKLQYIVSAFSNASITFISMNEKYKEFANKIKYPKELLYKFCIPSLFANYDKAIITDVDVIFLDDISKEFENFTTDEYFAGVKQLQAPCHSPFSLNIEDDLVHFICGAGYMIYNLAAMRKDDIERKCLNFFAEKSHYCKFPDQDVLSQVCYPKIKLLHPKNMVLSSYYTRDDYVFEFVYTATKEEYEETKDNPIQLHYVDHLNASGKPWLNPLATKSDVWYYYLSQTPFFFDHINKEKNGGYKKKKKLSKRIKAFLKKYFFYN